MCGAWPQRPPRDRADLFGAASPRGGDHLSTEDFLRQQSEAGSWHSSGSFSIDLSRARVKLGRYALAVNDYLLKLVQAATALGAVRLELRLGPRGVSALMRIQGDPERCSSRRLAGGLTRADLSGDRGLAHLLLALHGCSIDARATWTDCYGARLAVERGSLGLEQFEPTPGSCRFTMETTGTRVAPAWLARMIRYAPLELVLDGRALVPQVRAGRDFHLVERFEQTPTGGFHIRPYGPSGAGRAQPCFLRQFCPESKEVPDSGLLRCRLAAFVAAQARPSGDRLELLHDGVVVATRTLSTTGAGRLLCLAAADPGEVNLTGLRLPGPPSASLLGEIGQALEAMACDVRRHLGRVRLRNPLASTAMDEAFRRQIEREFLKGAWIS